MAPYQRFLGTLTCGNLAGFMSILDGLLICCGWLEGGVMGQLGSISLTRRSSWCSLAGEKMLYWVQVWRSLYIADRV